MGDGVEQPTCSSPDIFATKSGSSSVTAFCAFAPMPIRRRPSSHMSDGHVTVNWISSVSAPSRCAYSISSFRRQTISWCGERCGGEVGMPARVWLCCPPFVIKKNGEAHAHGKFGSMPAGF